MYHPHILNLCLKKFILIHKLKTCSLKKRFTQVSVFLMHVCNKKNGASLHFNQLNSLWYEDMTNSSELFITELHFTFHNGRKKNITYVAYLCKCISPPYCILWKHFWELCEFYELVSVRGMWPITSWELERSSFFAHYWA